MHKAVIGVLTTKTVRLVTRAYVKDFDTEALDIREGTWLYEFLKRLSESAEIRSGVNASEVERTHWALRLLRESESWPRIRSLSPTKLSARDLAIAFSELEAKIDEMPWMPATKRNTSSEFRKLVMRDIEATLGMAVHFAPRTYGRLPPRPLISDLQSPSTPLHPIGATPHETVRDLKDKIKSRLSGDLDQVRSACEREFNSYSLASDWMLQTAEEPIPDHVKQSLEELLQTSSNDALLERLRQASGEMLFRYYMNHVGSDAADSHVPPRKLLNFAGAQHALQFVKSKIALPAPVNAYELFHYPYLGSGAQLLTSLLILQIHTGWNASSVLSLRSTDIERGQWRSIQGFKTRTDDHTPPVLVEASDTTVLRVLKFLMKRLTYLLKHRLVPKDSTSLWLHARGRKPNEGGKLYVGFSRALKDFQKRNGLSDFSLEQVRTQVLATTSISSSGIETARRIGGHASAFTTAHYLDQLLLQRLNSSMNLEFQQRLERSVQYVASTKDGRTHCREPNDFLLYPTGTGTSCIEPGSPPKSEWLQDGVCAALHCHQGTGCPNRRIVVDQARIEEVVASIAFYETQWRRLFDENPEKFRTVHAPAMLFNLALAGVLERGPYGPLFRKTEKRLSGQG